MITESATFSNLFGAYGMPCEVCMQWKRVMSTWSSMQTLCSKYCPPLTHSPSLLPLRSIAFAGGGQWCSEIAALRQRNVHLCLAVSPTAHPQTFWTTQAIYNQLSISGVKDGGRPISHHVARSYREARGLRTCMRSTVYSSTVYIVSYSYIYPLRVSRGAPQMWTPLPHAVVDILL